MQIEQLPPNKPNFKLILYLSCAAILAIFVVALVLLRTNEKHMTMGLKKTTAITQPVMPRPAGAPLQRSTPV